jgi:hypothetical protein
MPRWAGACVCVCLCVCVCVSQLGVCVCACVCMHTHTHTEAHRNTIVVIGGAFCYFLLHNHFITKFFYKKKSGEVKDSVFFPLFFTS